MSKIPAADKPVVLGGSPVRRRNFPRWPVFDDAEEHALLEVLRSGNWWSNSQGEAVSPVRLSKVGQFEEQFANFQHAAYAVACSSGTAALEISLKSVGIGPGDEVIVPPYTFVATASAPLLLGAVPVFCDIDADTLNLDPKVLESSITPRTRAIIPVHFAGLPADMENILRIASRHNLAVIEDAAHAHGAIWNGKAVGALGDAGTFSFQVSKNMTAGEGGAVVTNRRDLAELCESYIWLGREADGPWYEHHRLGWNYRLTEFQAAILIAQLQRLDGQMALRMRNGLRLNEQLAKIPGILPLQIPAWVDRHSFHLYVFRFDQGLFGINREQFLSALGQEGIPCSAGYAHPLYQNPLFLQETFHANGKMLAGETGSRLPYKDFKELCPNAERACEEMVWIEHRVLLGSDEDIEDVVRAISKIYEYRDQLRAAGS